MTETTATALEPGSAALPPDPGPESDVVAPSPAGTVEAPPPGVLVGVVRFADERTPIDVHVVVTRKVTPEEVHEIRTTVDGQVRFDRLVPGKHRLRATHPDYAPVSFAFEVAQGGGAGLLHAVSTQNG